MTRDWLVATERAELRALRALGRDILHHCPLCGERAIQQSGGWEMCANCGYECSRAPSPDKPTGEPSGAGAATP